jgi:hypothetical protein
MSTITIPTVHTGGCGKFNRCTNANESTTIHGQSIQAPYSQERVKDFFFLLIESKYRVE